MKLTITTEIHGKMKATFNIFLFSLVFLLLSNCTPKESHINKYEKIPFLHEIKGTKNYEIIQIGDTLGGKVSWDKINRYFILNTFHSDATLNQYYKYSLQGDIIDSVSAENAFFEDDIFTFNNFYNTWVKDGDKTNQKFIKIISNEDPKLKDSTKYLKIFNKYYNNSKYVLYSSTKYYFFNNNKWYVLYSGYFNQNLKKYPEKKPNSRLQNILLNPNPPNFVKQFFVPLKNNHINSNAIGATKNFSTGTWIMRVGLSGGDSLIYRRLGDGLGNLTTFYQLPTSKGGNDSILFISQEYNNQKGTNGSVYFSHGGLFMIKPKKKNKK